MEIWQVQNPMGEPGRLETQERAAIQVQRQVAIEQGRTNVAGEV